VKAAFVQAAQIDFAETGIGGLLPSLPRPPGSFTYLTRIQFVKSADRESARAPAGGQASTSSPATRESIAPQPSSVIAR